MKVVSKYKKIWISFALLLIFGVGIFVWQKTQLAIATNIENAYMKFHGFDPEAELGSKENPFIILEIVPYRGMGQIGYIVGGQEPVDPGVSKPDNNLYGVFNGFANDAFEPYQVKKDRLDEEDRKNLWVWQWVNEQLSGQTGFFERLTKNNGLYLRKYENGKYSFVKDPNAEGNYNWVAAVNTENIPTDYEADKVWLSNYTLDVSYWTNSKNNNWLFRNKEIFKREVLGLSDEEVENFHVRVVTITPDVLNENVKKFTKYYDLSDNGKNNKVLTKANADGEIDLIGNADLISISPLAQAGNNAVIDLWEKYGRDKSGKMSQGYNKDFGDNDLQWQTVMELFMKIGVVEDAAPLIYDMTMITNPKGNSKQVYSLIGKENGKGYSNNVYKLLLILRQRDPVAFYNSYLNTNGGEQTTAISMVTDSKGNTTGSYAAMPDEDAKVYWNYYTFLPPFPDGNFPPYIAIQEPNYKKYLVDLGIILGWEEHHDAVIRNTYSYNGGTDIVQRFAFINYNLKELKETATRVGYNIEFYDYLEEEAKKANPNANRPTTATPREAVTYILQYKKAKPITKESITILELEPSNDFHLTAQEIRKILPEFSGKISIVQLTTAEFISKKEDLNSTYDLIYIGTQTGKMNTRQGKTVYNDPLMDGLVYTHVGDRMIAFDAMRGILKDGKALTKIDYGDYSKEFIVSNIFKGYQYLWPLSFPFEALLADFYRYSGNDITLPKKQELQDFIDAGYPVLLDHELYERNVSFIDDSSHLYQWIDGNMAEQTQKLFFDYDNILGDSGSDKKKQKELAELLYQDKIHVNLISKPVEYDENHSDTLLTERKLNYTFVIKAPSGAKKEDSYQWKLYVDSNSDGRYTTNEMIASGSGKAEENIHVSGKLPQTYEGAAPWKLVVYSSKNSKIRTEKTGLTAFRAMSSNLDRIRTQIKILQITSNDNSTMNLEELLNPSRGKTSLLYHYTKDLEDFNISVNTITVQELERWYEGEGNAYDPRNPVGTDKLMDYDMLIFGFGDHYSDISNANGVLSNVQAFIDSGKSVMITHDTTSFINLPKNDFDMLKKDLPYWGYGFNKYLRGRAGMDRFGAQKAAGDQTTYDTATIPKQARTKKIYEKNGNTYPEMQGFTYGALVAYGNPSNVQDQWTFLYDSSMDDRHKANQEYPPFAYGNALQIGTAIDNYKSNFITKVNQGQITTYPYIIPDGIKVGTTHMQYYQLNLDDPEIVVWYALSDNKSLQYPGNEKYADVDHSYETGPYSVSPNDGRNNYYLYSKGNIMYSGVGHTAIDKLVDSLSDHPEYEYEVKLFINTIIATYRLGATAPKVTVINEDAVSNKTEYTFYEDYDATLDYSSSNKRIRFIAEDMNFPVENLVVRIYRYDSSNQLVRKDLPIIDVHTQEQAKVYQEVGKEPGYIVTSGKEYYIDYPLASFGRNGNDKILITASNSDDLYGNASVLILGRILFDLD